MLSHTTEIRVRYAETDQMGYLYYGHYAQYYEVGRAEMIRSLGMSYSEMERVHGIMMPVMSLQIRYVRPAYYDDLLRITTTLRELPSRSISFHVEIHNQKGELINSGTVKLCFIEQTTKARVDAPAYLQAALQPYFETV